MKLRLPHRLRIGASIIKDDPFEGLIVTMILTAILPKLLKPFFVKKTEEEIEQEKLASGTYIKCPHCSEVIKKDAAVCRFCGKELQKNE